MVFKSQSVVFGSNTMVLDPSFGWRGVLMLKFTNYRDFYMVKKNAKFGHTKVTPLLAKAKRR